MSNTDWRAYKELLFVDQSLEELAVDNRFPDDRMAEAFALVNSNQLDAAKRKLYEVAGDSNVEVRVRLWAGRALRDLDEPPPADIGAAIQGVVSEVPTGQWTDTLAAYADGRVRYLNGNGGAIVWEMTEDSPINGLALGVIFAAAPVVEHATLHEKHLPSNDNVLRDSILTFNGVYVIEDNINNVAGNGSHPMLRLFDATTALFLALMDEHERAQQQN